MRGVNDVGFDCQIFVKKLGRERIVGVDAADLGGGDHDGVWAIVRQPGFDGRLIAQIELFAVGLEHVVAAFAELARDR